MTVYLVNFALILLFALLINPNKSESAKNKKLYCGIVALQWILISGLRHFSVGADTEKYYDWFENVKKMSWNYLFEQNKNYVLGGRAATELKDPGFSLFVKIFQIFSDNYQLFLILIAVVFTSLMAVWIYRNSSNPCISFIIYSSLFYSFFAITGHRQTFATALVVFLGYECVKKRKILGFIIVTFLAYMMHKSALIFVLYYFVSYLKINKKVLVAYGMVALVAMVMGNAFYGPLIDFIGLNETWLNTDGPKAFTYGALMLVACAVALFMYPRIKRKRSDADIIYHLILLTMVSTVMVFQNNGFMRIQQYFSLAIMLLVPDVLNEFKDKDKQIITVLFVCFAGLYLVRQNPQYLFFWQ